MQEQGMVRIGELRDQASACLGLAADRIQKDARFVENDRLCLWRLELDSESEVIPREACAVACGILALHSTVGSSPRVERMLVGARESLFDLQQDDGGWTSIQGGPEEIVDSLTLDTYFALQALLMDEGSPESDEKIRKGFEWLLDAVNPSGPGWGFYKGATDSRTLPTTYAIRTLRKRYGDADVRARDAVTSAVDWLLGDVKTPEGAWGQKPGAPPSVVHTAATLMALDAAGFSPYSADMVQGRTWLLEHLDEKEQITEFDYEVYRTNRRTSAREFHARISHTTFPEGFVLQSLMTAGTSILDERLLDLVHVLTTDQKKNGTWPCHERPSHSEPIYAVVDACLALRMFASRVAQQAALLEIVDPLRELTSRTTAMERKIQDIDEAISRSSQRIEQDVARFEEIMGWMRPLIWFFRPLKRYPWILFLLGILAGDVFAIFFLEKPWALDVAGAIYAFGLASLQIYLAIQLGRAKSHTGSGGSD